MPELPELVAWSRQAKKELAGKTIALAEVFQPKCLNVPPEEITAFLAGRTVQDVRERGKWMFVDLAPDGHLLLNLGMGGEFYYASAGSGTPRSGEAPAGGAMPPPGPAGTAEPSPTAPKLQFKLTFTDGATLGLRFWWFGYVHLVRAGEEAKHAMTAELGPSPLDPELTLERFRTMVSKRPRRSVKSFLMDQRCLAGVGNVYVQDSLWGAGLHPDRMLGTLSPGEVEALWTSLRGVLGRSVAKGGFEFERDFYGRSGGYSHAEFAVGYRPGEPCPKCGTAIKKIRTGATSTFICPKCQPL